jgi:SPP1 family predicted phage head-tail adaptor
MSKRDTAIGKLRHRITIQQATETRGADGSVVQTWATYCTGYAEIVPLSGSEDYIAQGLNASVVHRVTIRYRSGIVPKMQVLWGARTLEIVNVRNLDERGKWLVMNCEESV